MNTIKVQLTHPTIHIDSKLVEIKIPSGLDDNQLIDWIYENKKQILKENGCNLSDWELSHALSLGSANVKIIRK